MDLPKGFNQEVIEARENARKSVGTHLINRGGSSFETHVLHKTRNNNLCFKLSTRLGFESVILFGLPLAFIGFIIYEFSSKKSFDFLTNSSFIYLVLVYFTLTLLSSLFGNLKHYTFSKNSNRYFVGFPLLPHQLAYTKYTLDHILAIQVLGENLMDKNSVTRQKSFELNLVFKDLKRVHVIDHNNLQGMLDDAEELSTYLNVPIWHVKSSEDSTSINWKD